ncbi:MAG: hypothetical protein IPK25_08265 [Saprospiraceae bacterium]|nr:hypothetical protein [Saprospiraceae bacterium]
MVKKKGFQLILIFVLTVFIQSIEAQTLQKTANFQTQDIPVTISPENPGICDPLQGVEVTVIEDFESYIWTSPGHPTLDGKTVKTHFFGEWTVNVGYVLNGVLCYKEIKFFVYDLKNPAHIKKYFVDQDFWPVTVYKVPVETSEPPLACRNCTCSDQLEEVGFDPDIAFMKLTENVELFEAFIPFQDLDYHKSITNNNCLCNTEGGSTLPEFEAAMQNGDLALWGHQFFMSPAESQGTLYLKGRMSWQEQSPVGEHRTRLSQIKDDILNYNAVSTAQQAKALFTNLLMTNPIGGYNLMPTCPDPQGCYTRGNFLTPSGVPVTLPEGSAQFVFAGADKPNGVFEGALLGMTDGNKIRRAYEFKSSAFSGYFHELSATVKDGFVSGTPVGNDPGMHAYVTRKCQTECDYYRIPVEDQSFLNKSSGGISAVIKPQITEDFISSCIDEASANTSNGIKYESFLSPAAGIISIPSDRMNVVRFTYNEYETNNVEEVVGGMLWKFELISDQSENCEIESYTYDLPSSTYINSTGQVYIDPVSDIDVENFKFNYLMNCGGLYQVISLSNGGRPKHQNSGVNYQESFSHLTDQIGFIPGSNGYNIDYTIGGNGFSIPNHLECSYCPDQKTGALIIRNSSYCHRPEHIFVEKIAQLATVYPEYFIDPDKTSGLPVLQTCLDEKPFTQYLKWEDPIDQHGSIEGEDGTISVTIPKDTWFWGEYLSNHPDILNNLNNPVPDRIPFFKEFIKQIRDFKVQQKIWWQNISQKTVPEIICHLRNEPQAVTSEVLWAEKEVALNILYPVNQTDMRNDVEYAIIHLLASSAPNEVISHIENRSIEYYWNTFQDHIFGQDNKTRLFTLIASKVLENNAPYYPNMEQFYNNPSLVPGLEANMWDHSNLLFTITDNNVYLYGPIPLNFGYTFDYNQIVPIKINGEITINGVKYKTGTILFLPAIQAALYAYSNDQAVAERRNWALLDLGLMTLGVGSYKFLWSTASYLRKASISADIAGSILGLSAQLIDNIDEETRNKIQFAALVSSSGEIGVGIVQAVRATRRLITLHGSKIYARNSAEEIRLALAKKDLHGFNEAWEFVRTHPRGADAWESITDAAHRAFPTVPDAGQILRKDLSSLQALARYDNVLIEQIGQQRLDNFLESLIKAYPKCNTCGNLGDPLVGNLDDVLDNLRTVATQRAVNQNGEFVAGFIDFIIEAGQTDKKAKGATLTLRKLANEWDEISEGGTYTIRNFEGNIPDIETEHRLDVLLRRINPITGVEEFKMLEMKNWSQPRSVSGSVYDQFKAHVSSGRQFEYHFSEGIQEGMKNSFQNVFKNIEKAEELFIANPSFFRNLSIDIDSPDDLVQLANNGDLISLINWVK